MIRMTEPLPQCCSAFLKVCNAAQLLLEHLQQNVMKGVGKEKKSDARILPMRSSEFVRKCELHPTHTIAVKLVR